VGRLIGIGIVALDDGRELVTPRTPGMALLHFRRRSDIVLIPRSGEVAVRGGD
jgi:hypothetical protein